MHATNTRYPRFFIRDLPMTAITRGITMHADRFDFVRRNVISKAHLAGGAGTGLFDIMRSIECRLGANRSNVNPAGRISESGVTYIYIYVFNIYIYTYTYACNI